MRNLDELLDGVSPELLGSIGKYYTGEVLPGHTIFDVWETEGALGSKMTPATASAGYREFLSALIAKQAPEEARILSVGFGNGKVETTLRALGYRVFGVELFWRALEGGKTKGLQVIQGSGHLLPFAAQKFDLVLLDGSLGHMPSLRQTLQEVSRVTVLGGLIIISDDPPSNSAAFEINPRVFLIRLCDEKLLEELWRAWPGMLCQLHRYAYDRSGEGCVTRRIAVVRLPGGTEDYLRPYKT